VFVPVLEALLELTFLKLLVEQLAIVPEFQGQGHHFQKQEKNCKAKSGEHEGYRTAAMFVVVRFAALSKYCVPVHCHNDSPSAVTVSWQTSGLRHCRTSSS
jgi:hypothetical protein